MASNPQDHSDFPFCNEFCDFSTPPLAGNCGGGTMWAHQGLPLFDNNNGVVLDMVPTETEVPSLFSVPPLPEGFGLSDMAVPDLLPEFSAGLRAGSQSFEVGGYYPDGCELGEDCSGFVQDFPMVYASSNDNWGFQVSQVPAMEESSLKVGKYSVEERKDRILRYLKKRNQRNFNKTIKYECRKTLADKRVRVRGRFARNTEQLCEEQALTKKNSNDNPQEIEEFFYNDETIKIKQDGEDWLQEAMANLMYFPYISG